MRKDIRLSAKELLRAKTCVHREAIQTLSVFSKHHVLSRAPPSAVAHGVFGLNSYWGARCGGRDVLSCRHAIVSVERRRGQKVHRMTAGTLKSIIKRCEKASGAAHSHTPSPSIEAKPGILIAAKHRGYRKLLETWFRDHGFNVWATANGCEALEQHRAQRGKITVALLDVYMPFADGSRTLASIRRESPSLPCVLMCRDLNKRLEKKLLA